MIEFLKKHRREILITLGWIVVSVLYFYSMLMFILNNNFFSWDFTADVTTYASLLVSIFMLFMILTIAKITVGNFSLVVSFIIVVLFGILAVVSLIPDSESVLRSVVSPLIFRLTLSVFFISPLLIWLAYPFKNFRVQKRQSKS